MFPLKDEIRSESTPWLTWLLITVNAAVFSYELSLGEALNDLAMTHGLVPWKMTRGISENGFSVQDNVTPWVTSMFLHGGWLHFLGNMWFLYIFGDNVEDRLGRGRYLALYLSGGLLAALTQVVASPASPLPMVGASGAIAAVMGAYVVLYPRARVFSVIPIFILFYFVRIPAFIFIGVWFGLQFLQGYASLLAGTETGGVAWWAHIGGLLGGILLALILRSGTRPRAKRDFRRGSVNVIRGPWGRR